MLAALLATLGAALPTQSPNLDTINMGNDYSRCVDSEIHPAYPEKLTQAPIVRALIGRLDGNNIWSNIDYFTSFHNRRRDSVGGVQASDWLLEKVKSYVPDQALSSGVVTVGPFVHSDWPQRSIVAKIWGRTHKTVVVGSHIDSINAENLHELETARAPGADDNASGTITILEAFRVLLTSATVRSGRLPHTIEFHWYAGEEDGLQGSKKIFDSYKHARRPILAMLNIDMTGYSAESRTTSQEPYALAGKPSFGEDDDSLEKLDVPGARPAFSIVFEPRFTGVPLAHFTIRVINEYTNSGVEVSHELGFDYDYHSASSGYRSAALAGYDAVKVAEALKGEDSSEWINTSNDVLQVLDKWKIMEHAMLVVGWVVELAFVDWAR